MAQPAEEGTQTLVAECGTEKIIEVQTQPDSLVKTLDDSEREFIANGIHNFSYRREESYDIQASEDLRRELKSALKAIGCSDLIPDHVVDQRVDSAVLPLGQKKGYWLKRLIGKTSGDTQRLLRGLDKVNMFLRNYGVARRKPPVPPKNIRMPIEKFQELTEKASVLDIKELDIKEKEPFKEKEPMQDTQSYIMELSKIKQNTTQVEPIAAKDTIDDEDSSDDSDRPRQRRRRKKYSERKERKHKKPRYYESESESSEEESDASDDELQYYIKRFKKPSKYYSYKKPRALRQQLPLDTRPRDLGRVPQEYFNTNVPLTTTQSSTLSAPARPLTQYQSAPKQSFQQNFVAPVAKPNNEYINHFLGNGSY